MIKFCSWLLFFFSLQTLAKDHLPDTVKISDSQFEKCSEVRITKALFFDVLDLGLYTPNCKEFSSLTSEEPKIIRFSYLRDVSGADFKEGAEEYLEKNLSQEQITRCSEAYDYLNSKYLDVADGDYYQLIQRSDKSIYVTLNEQFIGQVNNPECAMNYYKIWFGKESMDSGFQDLLKIVANQN